MNIVKSIINIFKSNKEIPKPMSKKQIKRSFSGNFKDGEKITKDEMELDENGNPIIQTFHFSSLNKKDEK